MNQKTQASLKRSILTLSVSVLILAGIILPIGVIYANEAKETERGSATYRLSYRYYLKNEGPVNLTSITIRLAILKSWDPVQTVSDMAIETLPNQTTTDEYGNEYAWYEFEDFRINDTLDLRFDVNLTLHFVDFTKIDTATLNYNTSSEVYKLFTAFHPLEDNTDANIRNVAQSLEEPDDILKTEFNVYNFTAHYLQYKLQSQVRGASYAIRNGNGDCDEYTTLFVALSRALGIPAVGHTAWLADFLPGMVYSDEGAVAHAYPMFYVENVGMLPADPTRGKTSTYDNWLKTDSKRITLTRGPDNPYRLLRYRWIPVEGLENPQIFSNYTISIQEANIQYTSNMRLVVILTLVAIPGLFILYSGINGQKVRKQRKKKLAEMLSPTTDNET